MQKLTRFLKNAIIIFIINAGVLIALVYVVEFYLRRSDPFPHLPFDTGYFGAYRQRYEGTITPPDDSKDYYYTWGHRVVNNRFSRRDRDFDTPKPKGTIRIIVLGDSFTWGAGLSVNQRYSDLLDSMLNSAFPEKKWEVVNFGFSGGPTTGEADVFQNVKDVVDPDLVVVGFCLNDPQPRSQSYSPEREEFTLRQQPKIDSLKSFLQRHNLIYFGDRIERMYYRYAEKRDIIPEWEESINRTYSKSSQEWNGFVHALADIKHISDSLKCPPPLFATLNQYNSHDKYFDFRSTWFEQAREAADSVGFTTVVYGDEITKRVENGLLTFPKMVINPLEPHPSAEVNRIYAEGIFNAIRDNYVPELTGTLLK